MQFHKSAHGPGQFLVGQSAFCHSAAQQLHAGDFIALVETYGIGLSRENARAIILRRLVAANHRHAAGGVPKARAQLRLGVRNLRGSRRAKMVLSLGQIRASFRCRSLVVATGGPSIPKMGSSGLGYKIAEQFGLKIVAPRPALVL